MLLSIRRLMLDKFYGREEYFSRRFEPVLESHRLAMNGNSIYDAWFPCIMQTVRAAVIAGAVLLAAKFNGTPLALGLSAGAISAAADLFIRLFEPIEAMASELLTIQQRNIGDINLPEDFVFVLLCCCLYNNSLYREALKWG